MFYKILIEPAKSNKSSCRNCGTKIQQNTLRVKVADARNFNEYIKKHGRENLSGEGLSRGYFQCVGPHGENISIEKYFVHLNCYLPLDPHPFEKQYFDTKALRKEHKEIFENWLKEKSQPKPAHQMKKKYSKKKVVKGKKPVKSVIKGKKKGISKKTQNKTRNKTKINKKN